MAPAGGRGLVARVLSHQEGFRPEMSYILESTLRSLTDLQNEECEVKLPLWRAVDHHAIVPFATCQSSLRLLDDL